MEEALVFLDRHGRYVTATMTALELLHVVDRELASFQVAQGQDSDGHELADWGALAERGVGIGESLLVSPSGERYEVTVLVTHIPTGWQLTIEPLAAWRGAERRLADGNEPTVREVDRLRRQNGQLTAHLLGEADEAVDAAPSGTIALGADPPNRANAET